MKKATTWKDVGRGQKWHIMQQKKKERKSEVWISVNTWKELEERSKLKNKVSDAKLERLRRRWLKEYQEKDTNY